MDRHSPDLANPQGGPALTGGIARPIASKRSFAPRWFGYDIFLSFALGPPPRGTHSYASDLGRRLRERDFTVFFSEDEAPPGEQLDSTLRTGLLHSKTLIVIANRGTLQEPRWVRKEVEEFRIHHPDRPVIPINVGGALQDPTLAESAQKWLDYKDKIWLDESEEAVTTGIASNPVVERLATAPTRAKSNVKWRWVVRGVVTVLAALAIGLGVTAKLANDSAERAREELRRAVSMRLVVEAQVMISGARSGGDERALLQLLAAQRIAPGAEAEGGLLGALIRRWDLHKLIVLGVPVMAVAISPDGRHIVSGSDEGLRLWDARTGQPITATLDARTSKVHSMALSPDGNLPGVTDVPRRLWSVKSGRYVMSVAFSPDGRRVISGDWYGTLRQWDARTGESIGAPLEGHKGEVLSVAYSPDGSRIVSSSSGDCTVRIWASETGLQLGAAIQGHRMPVTSVAFSPDGERIVSGGYEQTLRRWDVKTGRPIGAPLGEYAAVRSVAFSPDGSRIVSGLSNKTLRLWDARTGQPIGAPFDGHKGDVLSVAFSPDGSHIVSGSGDGTLRLWDARTGQPIGAPFGESIWAVSSVAFSPDGSRIVSGGRDGTVRVWNAEAAQRVGAPLEGHKGMVESVAFSPDSGRIVSGSDDGTLRLWDAKTGQPIGAPFKGHKGDVLSVAFSPDGSRIVSGGKDLTLRLWDAKTGEPIGVPLEGHKGDILSVAFSPDGRRIVSGSYDSTLRLWDARTGQPIGAPFEGHKFRVWSAAFSPDSNRIVSGSEDRTLRLWDARTGQPIGAPFEGHKSEVASVAFSPDGGRIVSGSWDTTLRLWDAKTGEPVGVPLEGHQGDVGSVAFSPDGGRIISGSGDGTLRLWDAKTRQPIGAPLEGHDGDVKSVAFSPDGSRIVSGGRDGTLRLWPAPKAWPEELCKKLTRNMSYREWREWVSPELEYIVQCPGLPIPSDESAPQKTRNAVGGAK